MLFAPSTDGIAQKLNFLEKFEIWSKTDFHFFLTGQKMVIFCLVFKIIPKCEFLSYDYSLTVQNTFKYHKLFEIEISRLVEYSTGPEISMKFGHPSKFDNKSWILLLFAWLSM